MQIELTSLDATRRLGVALGCALPERAIVLCPGEMGSGKTTLIKSICEGLGVRRETVISPTYMLVNIYRGLRPVYHVDLFRLSRVEELLEMDRCDWINSEGPTLIEWPEIAMPLLAGETALTAHMSLVTGADNHRMLALAGDAEAFQAVFTTLDGATPAPARKPVGTPGGLRDKLQRH
ncbi:MAG: tRNA (adenosine(37)-N6)-threonylcarbamoyltransferase complex ATPase subunit type 1 TsaE [SAR324 cluster bacterium]|nr:tRNA (adenosine(37)-N6)-threonylcarbamoyltransferase complex ATPase subunit type 1 TsaE [SAR324 cluster bacterium]